MNRDFWRGRRVLMTGHTGFKGSWLAQWLKRAGAEVTGYSVDVPTHPSHFEAAAVGEGMTSIFADVRDLEALRGAVASSRPEIVVHLAAQSLVCPSYEDPVGTYATNVMGTVNLLEAMRAAGGVRVVLIVTSDKCYENRESPLPFREDDPMGGHDPYSSSKGCAELVTAAYRNSFFSRAGSPRVVTVRAGNVIGGGDWARNRLVPDLVRAFTERQPAVIRNPSAIRPWQFVLDPLDGYLRIAEAAYERDDLPDAWNFGPLAEDERPVSWVADQMAALWGREARWVRDTAEQPHEAFTLMLDSSRARTLLGWKHRIDAATAIEWTARWYRAWLDDPRQAASITDEQLSSFEAAV